MQDKTYIAQLVSEFEDENNKINALNNTDDLELKIKIFNCLDSLSQYRIVNKLK